MKNVALKSNPLYNNVNKFNAQNKRGERKKT